GLDTNLSSKTRPPTGDRAAPSGAKGMALQQSLEFEVQCLGNGDAIGQATLPCRIATLGGQAGILINDPVEQPLRMREVLGGLVTQQDLGSNGNQQFTVKRLAVALGGSCLGFMTQQVANQGASQ